MKLQEDATPHSTPLLSLLPFLAANLLFAFGCATFVVALLWHGWLLEWGAYYVYVLRIRNVFGLRSKPKIASRFKLLLIKTCS